MMTFTLSSSSSTLIKRDSIQFSNLRDTTDRSLCRAVKMSGKYVFMNSEPINDYEVVYYVKLSGLVSGGSPTEIASLVLTKALKMEKEEGKPFDAVIIGSTKYDLAIKFK